MRNFRALLLLFALVTVSAFSFSQSEKSGFITCSQFGVSRPLRDIARDFPVDESAVYEKKESEDRERRKPQRFEFSVRDGKQYGNDSLSIQNQMGRVRGRAPIANWVGQSATGFRPMDPSGAAGPSHYVQMINSTTFKVYDKASGTVLLTTTFGNLWSPATPNDGDPIVLYDMAANRWFLAQFGQTGNKMYIAVSTTGDPTGTYYTYTFTSPEFPDYLKFSVWTDGYYMTSNQTQKVFAFERSAMLAGNAAARAVYTGFSPPQGTGFFVPLPGDASDGSLPPAGTPCPIFSYSDNGWGTGYSDAVNIYQMSVNWSGATPTGTITLAGNIPAAAFDASYDANWNDVSQPGTTQKLDGIGGVCMYRAQWKSWNSYNTVLLNWAVKISTTQRSIKWCELRQNQSTGVWSMYQEGIYTPDGATRWMGSMAMDNNGSIGIAYMKTDAANTIYPGIYYTGRRNCDPLGTLPLTETMAVAGTGYQTGANRNGDYAEMVLDPDGQTFWYTGEYMGGTSGSTAARTRIFSFQIQPCDTLPVVTIAQTEGTSPLCPNSSATFTATAINGGSNPAFQWQVNGINVGTNSNTFSSSTLTSGQTIRCIMTSSIPGIAGNPDTSNVITISIAPVVTPSVSIALTSGSNPACSGSSLTFTANPVNGGASPTYQWKVNGTNTGSNSAVFVTSSLTNGQTVTCVMTSNSNCTSTPTATSNGITISIQANGNPTVSIAQTGGSSPICAGSSATFTASVTGGTGTAWQWKVDGTNVGTNNSSFTTTSLTNGQIITCQVTATATCPLLTSYQLGTGTSNNATTSTAGAVYPTYYGNGRQQYLIRASELTALGMAAGTISSVSFSVANTVAGDPATLNGYTIRLATSTATTATTTFQTPTFTTVWGPQNYTPQLGVWNLHVFSTPFSWNGTSNILVDLCFANQVTGVSSYQNYYTTSSFTSTTYYFADGSTGAGACTQTTGSTTTRRPNMQFRVGNLSSISTSNAITVSVNPLSTPSVAITANPSGPVCNGTPVTFSAAVTNGGSSPAYTWRKNGVSVGTSTTYIDSQLVNGDIIQCILISNASCLTTSTASSNTLTMSIQANTSPSLQITAIGNCPKGPITFNATITNGGTSPNYQWKVNNVNAGTNSPSFTYTPLDGDSIKVIYSSYNGCNSLTTVSGVLIIDDTTPPSVPVLSTLRGQCGLSVSAPTTSDNCAGTITGTTSSTLTYSNQGTYAITWSFNDGNGNISTAIQTVIVDDTIPPTPPVLATVRGQCAASVSAPSASDNCAGTITGTTSSPLTYSNQGTYTIAWSFNDGNGNISTVSQNIVISDTIAPVMSCKDSIAYIQNGSSIVTSSLINNGSFDNCGLASITINPMVFQNTGVFPATLTATDIAGNTATCNSMVTIADTSTPPSLNLALRCFIEGFYVSNGSMNSVLLNCGVGNDSVLTDSVLVVLHSAQSPYQVIRIVPAILMTNGWLQTSLEPILNGQSLYIAVIHRNTIETWSATPVQIGQNTVYDFTGSSAQAYGSIQKLLFDGHYGFYSGDNNQDGVIDFLDQVLVDNDVFAFGNGYLSSDVTGDGVVDFLDQLIIDNNVALFIGTIQP